LSPLSLSCTPVIGDKCTVSTDCSVRGDRLCDTSQPGGYCTQLTCRAGQCADEASCVLFSSALPGCGFDDRSGSFGSRVARSFCMAKCAGNSDCRAGYVCADPRTAPWNAVILDDDQEKKSCLPIPAEAEDAGAVTGSAAVCGVVGPILSPIDAGPSTLVDGAAVIPPLIAVPFLPADAGHD
jgi:hypothetical protein